jgi:hypothetical protein
MNSQRSEVNERLDSVNQRLDSMNERFDSMQRTMIICFVTMTASIVAALVGVAFTA